MNTNDRLKLCEQLEKIVTKCRISDTDKAKNYMACQACAMYIRYKCDMLPVHIKRSRLESTQITVLWTLVRDHDPTLHVDRDALDTVERYISDPVNAYVSAGDMKAVYALLKDLSDMVHTIRKEG